MGNERCSLIPSVPPLFPWFYRSDRLGLGGSQPLMQEAQEGRFRVAIQVWDLLASHMLIACPSCSQQFVRPNVAAGFAASCPSCHSPVTIPGGTDAVPVHNPGASQSGANVPAIVLGIISALIGAFALLFCWIPFLGILVIPFAVIGAGIGSIGLIAVIFTRGKGLGMPLVGMCLCALSILISVLFTGATVSAIDEAMESERNAAIEIADSNGSVLERGESVSKAVPEVPRAKEKATANAENSNNMA